MIRVREHAGGLGQGSKPLAILIEQGDSLAQGKLLKDGLRGTTH